MAKPRADTAPSQKYQSETGYAADSGAENINLSAFEAFGREPQRKFTDARIPKTVVSRETPSVARTENQPLH